MEQSTDARWNEAGQPTTRAASLKWLTEQEQRRCGSSAGSSSDGNEQPGCKAMAEPQLLEGGKPRTQRRKSPERSSAKAEEAVPEMTPPMDAPSYKVLHHRRRRTSATGSLTPLSAPSPRQRSAPEMRRRRSGGVAGSGTDPVAQRIADAVAPPPGEAIGTGDWPPLANGSSGRPSPLTLLGGGLRLLATPAPSLESEPAAAQPSPLTAGLTTIAAPRSEPTALRPPGRRTSSAPEQNLAAAPTLARTLTQVLPPITGAPRIKSIKSRTYAQLETGLLLRRRALLATVRAARAELGRLCQAQMPSLLVTMRRQDEYSLEVTPGYSPSPSPSPSPNPNPNPNPNPSRKLDPNRTRTRTRCRPTASALQRSMRYCRACCGRC